MLKNGRADVLSTRYERLVSMGAARLPHNFTHVFEHRDAHVTILRTVLVRGGGGGGGGGGGV